MLFMKRWKRRIPLLRVYGRFPHQLSHFECVWIWLLNAYIRDNGVVTQRQKAIEAIQYQKDLEAVRSRLPGVCRTGY
jgi:hypothetical protein